MKNDNFIEEELKTKGLYVGTGWDDEGREYEGFQKNGKVKYYYIDDGSEVQE